MTSKNYTEVISELNLIFHKVFEREVVVSPETTAADIKEWDSLHHMNLIAEIEEHFRIEFEFDEVVKFKNVGDVAIAIQNKLH